MITENSLINIGNDLVVGAGVESFHPFIFNCSSQDFIAYLTCKITGGAGGCGVIAFEKNDKSEKLLIGVAYDYQIGKARTHRLSLKSCNGGKLARKGVMVHGVDIDLAVHFDCDCNRLNLYASGEHGLEWIGGCDAHGFEFERVRFSTRSNGPDDQSFSVKRFSLCRPNFVSIGDSVTAGRNSFDPRLGGDGLSQWQSYVRPVGLRNNIVINKGVGGQDTGQVNARISEATKHGNPVVFLSVQNNDYSSNFSHDQRTANIQSSIDKCVDAGCVVILYGCIYPNTTSGPWYKEWMETELSKISGHIQYIEIMDSVKKSDGYVDEAYISDHVHPTIEGYRRIGLMMNEAVDFQYE